MTNKTCKTSLPAGNPSRPSSPASKRPSARRIKDAARELRRLLSERGPDPLLSEAESLEWAARMLGFSSLSEASSDSPSEGARGVRLPYGSSGLRSGLLRKARSREILLSESAILAHEALTGSTGSGKSEALVSRARSLMESAPACGILYMDAYGDSSVFSRIFSHAAPMGRERDIRCVNLMGPPRELMPPLETDPSRPRSHSFNPLDGMGPSEEARWLWDTFGDSAAALGIEREARALFSAGAFAHATLKGSGGEDPGILGLAAWLSPRRLERALCGPRGALPAEAWEAIEPLGALAGSDFSSPGLLAAEALGASALRGWAEAFPHVFATRKSPSGAWLSPEASADWALQGGILLVLLPSLQKSADEIATLGRGILSSLRGAFRRSPCRPGSLRSLSILHDAGYFAPSSYSELMEEASRAGSGLLFAGADAASLCGVGKSPEAASLALSALGRCAVKTVMKSERLDGASRALLEAAFGSSPPSETDLLDLREGEAFVSLPGFSGPALLRHAPGDPRSLHRGIWLEPISPLPEPAPFWSPR